MAMNCEGHSITCLKLRWSTFLDLNRRVHIYSSKEFIKLSDTGKLRIFALSLIRSFKNIVYTSETYLEANSVNDLFCYIITIFGY